MSTDGTGRGDLPEEPAHGDNGDATGPTGSTGPTAGTDAERTGGAGSTDGGADPGRQGPAHLRHSAHALARRRSALGAKIVAVLSSLAILFYSGLAWSIANSANDAARRPGIVGGVIPSLPAPTSVAPGGHRPTAAPSSTGAATPAGAGTATAARPPTSPPPADVDGTDQNILLVGNDDRSGYTKQEQSSVGTSEPNGGGFNTDTLLVLHVPANGTRATIVSIPRDTWVQVPGFKDGKINSAYPDGACYPDGIDRSNQCNGDPLTDKQSATGARVLLQTVSNLTGVKIDHYIEISLIGFYRLSNAIGGVKVCLKKNVDDHWTGLKLTAGEHALKGTQALQFVRQRHNFPKGAEDGDLSRIRRQQAFLGAAVSQLISAHWLLEPWRLEKVATSVTGAMTVDNDYKVTTLATQMRNIAAGNVVFVTMPTNGPAPQDSDSLAADPYLVRAFFAKVIAGAPLTPRPTRASARPSPTKQPGAAPRHATGPQSTGTRTPSPAAGATPSPSPGLSTRTASDASCVY